MSDTPAGHHDGPGLPPTGDADGDCPRPPLWARTIGRGVAQAHHLVIHGDIHDLVASGDRYLQFPVALGSLLHEAGYETVAFYDPVDGFTFTDVDQRDSFDALAAATPDVADGGDGETGGGGNPEPTTARGQRAQQQERERRAALTGGRTDLRDPLDAFAGARRALRQTEVPIAVVVRYGELLLQDPSAPDRADRDVLAWLKHAAHDARLVRTADGGQLRNLLVVLTEDLAHVPAWLYRSDPLFQLVQVDSPDQAARETFLERHLDRFHGGADLTADERRTAVRLLAELTDGYSHWDLDALRRTSATEAIPASTGRRLVLMHQYGDQDDPFERLTLDRIRAIGDELRATVMGQDHAIDALVRMLGRARLRLGVDPDTPTTRPRGWFFFVGPTGVGKTELARALARALFGDENALERFDMSNYQEEHARLRLVGAPPSYVGFDQGGELTNRALARPHSVFLFDEIEKADPSVLDLFLQILDAGRLTDGMGRTVHFGEAVIIFTSNTGSEGLYQRIVETGLLPTFDEVTEHYDAAVEHHFVHKINRPELLGRLGKGIIPFDVLREEWMDPITRKELDRALRGLRLDREVEVDWPAVCGAIRRLMARPKNVALGGRAIGNLLLELVEGGLTDWWLADEPPAGATIHIGADADGAFTFWAG